MSDLSQVHQFGKFLIKIKIIYTVFTFIQGGQIILRLDAAADMALFLHMPAAVADNSQPTFLL
jgi:hypothetical protein